MVQYLVVTLLSKTPCAISIRSIEAFEIYASLLYGLPAFHAFLANSTVLSGNTAVKIALYKV